MFIMTVFLTAVVATAYNELKARFDDDRSTAMR